MQSELFKVNLKIFNLYKHTLNSFQTSEADNHLQALLKVHLTKNQLNFNEGLTLQHKPLRNLQRKHKIDYILGDQSLNSAYEYNSKEREQYIKARTCRSLKP